MNPQPPSPRPNQNQQNQEEQERMPPGGAPRRVQKVGQILNMYKRQFDTQTLSFASEFLKTKGESGSAPMFMRADLEGEWVEYKGGLGFRHEGKTKEVVATEDLQEKLKELWYRQDVPKGIHSFHSYVEDHYVGITRRDVAKFVKKQAAWQITRPLQKKKPLYRKSVLATKPFALCEIDLADMVSFQDHSGAQIQSDAERYVFVAVCAFSNFGFGEVQVRKTATESLKSWKKIVRAIQQLGYTPRLVRSDMGDEFIGQDWAAFQGEIGYKRSRTSRYPAVRAEAKVKLVKRYLRYNSRLTHGEGTKWWNVLTPTMLAINRIKQRNGHSPFDIVRMDLQAQKEVLSTRKENRETRKTSELPANHPKKGDLVRVRIVPEKRPMNYKAHLGINNDKENTNWSEIKTLAAVRHSHIYGTVKGKVEGAWYFWPGELQVVPEDTVPLEGAPTWGQDGNADFVQPRRGARRSRRRRIPNRRYE